MPARRQVHTYNQYEIESLKSVSIPPKIKCSRCRKSLPHAKYSTKQLTNVRYQIKTGGDYKNINCQGCTGPQVVEVQCMMCNKTKGLEKFAKSQRARPDNAKCFDCTTEQVNREPVNHERYESDDPRRAFLTPDHSNGVVPDYWSTAESDLQSSGWGSVNGDDSDLRDGGVALASHVQRAASINGSASGTLIETDSEVSYRGRAGKNDGWSEVPSGRVGSWHTGTRLTAAGSGSNGTSFSANAYGLPSTTSNAGTQRTYGSSVAERSITSSSSRFPRIPACRPGDAENISARGAGPVRGPFVRPSGDDTRELDNAWESDDDSEGNNNGDDSDDSDGENTVI